MTEKNFIFGIRAVIEAAEADKTFDKVLVKKGLHNELSKELYDVLKKYNIPVQYVPLQKIDRITKKNHQGVIGFISPVKFYDIDEIITRVYESGEIPFIIVLDGVTDVRNFGAVARTVECAGAHAILIPEKGAAQINADAIKTSAGALHTVPVCRTKNIEKTIKYLKNSGLSVYVADEKTTETYYQADFKKPFALIMGAEDKGVSIELRALADMSIKIPVTGNIKSLNVSVAAGILMYEALKQRTNL